MALLWQTTLNNNNNNNRNQAVLLRLVFLAYHCVCLCVWAWIWWKKNFWFDRPVFFWSWVDRLFFLFSFFWKHHNTNEKWPRFFFSFLIFLFDPVGNPKNGMKRKRPNNGQIFLIHCLALWIMDEIFFLTSLYYQLSYRLVGWLVGFDPNVAKCCFGLLLVLACGWRIANHTTQPNTNK